MRNTRSLLDLAVEAVSQLTSAAHVAQPDDLDRVHSLRWTHQLQAGALASSTSNAAVALAEPISRT